MPKPGPRTTYKYSDTFKATSVKLSYLPGVAIKDVAESLYIHPFMLSRWRKQAHEGLIMTKGVNFTVGTLEPTGIIATIATSVKLAYSNIFIPNDDQ